MLIQAGPLSCTFRPWRQVDGRVFREPFALDIETTRISGHEVPDYILGAVCDGTKGYFLPPAQVHDFLVAHEGTEVVLHNAPFDLGVLHALFRSQGLHLDVYELLDRNVVWDTLLLHRLHGLATQGHTHQGKGQSTLEHCAWQYLNISLPKEVRDADGDDVRTSWAKWQGRPPSDIPAIYLDYLGKDVLCTHGCFAHLLPRIQDALASAHSAWGYVSSDWLSRQQVQYGPQTHHLQVKAMVALSQIERTGFGLDLTNMG